MIGAGALAGAWWIFRGWLAVRRAERWRAEHEQLADPPIIVIEPSGETWEWPERRNGHNPRPARKIGG